MNIKESALEVIEHLRGLADGSIEPECTELGICAELHTIMEKSTGWSGTNPLMISSIFATRLEDDHRAIIYEGWEFWNGNIIYPVPHKNFLDPFDAYISTSNLWDGEFSEWELEQNGIVRRYTDRCKADRDHGILRLDLCDYLADYLEEMYL